RISRLDLNSTLKGTSRGAAGTSAIWGRGNNVRRLLVVSELALSVVLLIGAGLLIRSFARLQDVPPGFDPRDVLTFDLTMTGRKYNDKQTTLNTYRQLWERMEHLPGANAAGGVTSLPLSQAFAWTPITVEGRTPLPGEKFLNADERLVGGHYFEAMGIPLRRGRFFTDQDDPTKPVVVIVDECMADQLWPGQDPIGRRIHIVELQSKDPWQTVVGVVGRVKQDSLESNPRIAFYLPHTQFPARAMTIALRGSTDLSATVTAVKNVLRNLDLRQGMALALSGVIIGLAAAFLFTRLIRSLLFGVEATDPITFGAISLLLFLIALLASYIPAQRATRIDPAASLRCE